MALSDRDCRHGRQIGKCADCDLDHMEMAADAEARRVDELTALRKQDEALIRRLVDALGVATTPLAKDRQEVLRAITAGLARLESKEDIIAMAREANPEHDLTAMLPFLSRFAALVAAREREKCATECESLSHRSRWVRAGINGAPMETCQYAAAIRARLEGKP